MVNGATMETPSPRNADNRKCRPLFMLASSKELLHKLRLFQPRIVRLTWINSRPPMKRHFKLPAPTMCRRGRAVALRRSARSSNGRGERRAGASPGSPVRPGAACAHLRGASRDCADSCMGLQLRVPITRSGLSCLPPPLARHRAVPSTAVASPSARCSIARCRPILPPGWRFRMMAPGRARPQSPSGNSAVTSSAAS